MGLLQRIGEFFGFQRSVRDDVAIETPESDQEFGEPEEINEFRQKFVSGLFYCGGTKRQFFALTFEPNDENRESELLDFLEYSFPNCSEMRDNFGYSDDFVSSETVTSEYPEIEVGEL